MIETGMIGSLRIEKGTIGFLSIGTDIMIDHDDTCEWAKIGYHIKISAKVSNT